MSKPAPNAAAQFQKCPKTSEEIRVKGFAFCPFCAAKINADGDHNVVITPDIVDTYRAQQAAQPKPEPAPKPEPKPEPPKAETPKPAPEQPRVKSAEEIQEMIDKAFPKAPVQPPPPPGPHVDQTRRRQKPRSSILPLLIFAAVILGGGYYAWTLTQPQPTIIADPGGIGDNPPDPAAAGIDLTDTGSKPNPDITSAGRTLEIRTVSNGLVREIRFNYSNVRALPTQESKILDQLERGERIEPTGRVTDLRGTEHGEWYRVDSPASGYVRFGNTRAPSASAAKPPAAKNPAAKPAPSYAITPVEPGLRARTKKQLRIRTTPSRENRSNETGDDLLQGQVFTPEGMTPDVGIDPGQYWYKIPGGFVAKWETDPIAPPRPPSGSTGPTPRAAVDNVTPEIDAGDRGQSSTTRALDALRRPRDPAEPN